MASPTATAVRPPRPKKEPQTLVIPKNAAEEQKLKLERLMKNPVSRSGLCGPAEAQPPRPARLGNLRTPWRRPGKGKAAPSRVSFVAVLVLQRSCMEGELQPSIPSFFRFSF